MTTPSSPSKSPLLLDRLKAAEELLNGLAGFTENEVAQLKGALSNLVEVVNALLQVVDKEEAVQEAIKANRAKRLAEQIAREKAMVLQLLESGVIVQASEIGEQSIVIGREFSPEGEVLKGGRTQVRVDQFTPEAKSQVLGKGPGFVIEVPTGKFEVLEVYNAAPPKAPEVTPAAG